MNQKFLVTILSGFVVGVLISSFINLGPALAGLFIFLGLVFLLLKFVKHSVFDTKIVENSALNIKSRAFDCNLFLLVAVFFISVGLGVLRYEVKDTKDTSGFEEKIGTAVELNGIVIDESDERENYTRLTINSSGTKLLIYTQHYPEFNYGDEISFKGVLKEPSNFSEVFDWSAYLSKDDIYFEMFYPEVKFVSSGNGNFVKEKLFELKKKYTEALSKVIPEPHASFMAGLTVGARKSIPKVLQEDFRKTGIIHIVVLSGYNITLVADTIIRIFSFLPNSFGISFGVFGIILFAIMTGASATVVRASIMSLLVILARATGRIYEITWMLFLTGFL